MDRRARATAAGIIAALIVLALPVGVDAAMSLKRCGSTGKERCGRVVVPLDRSGTIPGTVPLNVRVLPARVATPTGTILLLAGGPGQAAAPLARVVPSLLGPLAHANQVVAFDQRGTGRSGFLRCRALDVGFDATAASRCAKQIGTKRTAYTTAASVEDIDAVRTALGVEKLTILGVSYGTKVALDYASAHPGNVDRLVLDSTLDPARPDPFSLSSFAAMPRVMRDICANDCPFTKDAAAELNTLAARLRTGPLIGRWVDGHGRSRQVKVTAAQLLGLISVVDVDPFLAALLPGAVHNAVHGDLAPLIGLTRSGGGFGGFAGGDSNAVLVATNCEDMAPVWPIGTPVDQRPSHIAAAIAALPSGAFGAFGPRVGAADSVPDICRNWPESPIAQPPVTTTDVPTLILSGNLDVRTPTEVADGLAARLPNASVVHVAGVGHSVLTSEVNGCATANLAAFLAGRGVSDCTRSAPLVSAMGPAPRRLADVEPTPRVPGAAGRVASAAALTLGDLVVRIMTAPGKLRAGYGGLRAGYATFSRDDEDLLLHRFSYVPGVELSGSANGTMRVRGPGRITGRVRVTEGGRMVGTIDGHRVSARIDNPLTEAMRRIAAGLSVGRASAILARWPTTSAITTSSSSALPVSPAA